MIMVRLAHLQHHGAANREKQRTVTLLAVTLVSLLTWLPGVILYTHVFNNSYWEIPFHSRLAISFTVLTLANSLVNRIMYAIRMAEFRSIVFQFFQRNSVHIEDSDIQLNAINL